MRFLNSLYYSRSQQITDETGKHVLDDQTPAAGKYILMQTHIPPTFDSCPCPTCGPSFTIRQSHTLTTLSTPALATVIGLYLFQSTLNISVPDAGIVNAAAESDEPDVGPGTKDGARRSKILSVPSAEPVRTTSGLCGENWAW